MEYESVATALSEDAVVEFLVIDLENPLIIYSIKGRILFLRACVGTLKGLKVTHGAVA